MRAGGGGESKVTPREDFLVLSSKAAKDLWIRFRTGVVSSQWKGLFTHQDSRHFFSICLGHQFLKVQLWMTQTLTFFILIFRVLLKNFIVGECVSYLALKYRENYQQLESEG